MRIGMILEHPYPEDIRVTKEINTLVAGGKEVFLLCARRKGEKYKEVVNGANIIRVDVGKSIYIKTLFDTINAAISIHPIFLFKITSFIKKNDLDFLHIHDLPLTNTALIAAKGTKVKLVLDMHENYPAGVSTWFEHKTNPIVKLKNRLFFNYNRWFRYEKKMIDKVDGIITVVKEMTNRLNEIHSIPFDKMVNITNNEPVSFLENNIFFEDIEKEYRDLYKIIYVGAFGPHRGLDTVIKGMPDIIKSIPNVRLILVGSGSIKGSLERLVKDLKIEKYVEFTGFQKFEKVFTYTKIADINIIPHKRNEHTDHTIPHKLYQGMMVGQTVLVSDCTPLERIINETDGGYVFEAENSESFAEVVVEIYNNPDTAVKKIKNAQYHTIDGEYNWDTTGKKLISFYEGL